MHDDRPSPDSSPHVEGRPVGRTGRSRQSETNYRFGLAAEAQVAAHYRATGHSVRASRWRGRSGEIDLILQKGDVFVFVEVKASSSLAKAAESLRSRQLLRIHAAALEYLDAVHASGVTEMRFDGALVDTAGNIEIVANLFVD